MKVDINFCYLGQRAPRATSAWVGRILGCPRRRTLRAHRGPAYGLGAGRQCVRGAPIRNPVHARAPPRPPRPRAARSWDLAMAPFGLLAQRGRLRMPGVVTRAVARVRRGGRVGRAVPGVRAGSRDWRDGIVRPILPARGTWCFAAVSGALERIFGLDAEGVHALPVRAGRVAAGEGRRECQLSVLQLLR